jgi:hypothetical protein
MRLSDGTELTWQDLHDLHDAANRTTSEKWWKEGGRRVYLAQCEVTGEKPHPDADAFPRTHEESKGVSLQAMVRRQSVWHLVKHGLYLTTKRNKLVLKLRAEAGWVIRKGRWVKETG